MERTISAEDRIRRAQEIYAKRQGNTIKRNVAVNIDNKKRGKDIKLLKKMIIQILVSLLIYVAIYVIQNSNFIFSQDFLNKVNEVLSYDMNFGKIYESIKQSYNNLKDGNNVLGIGGASDDQEQSREESKNEEQQDQIEQEEPQKIEEIKQEEAKPEEQSVVPLTQEEQEIANVKATTSFIKPVEAVISSPYGHRESSIATVPKNHTGVDLAANMGTKIKSATAGEVVLNSEKGDYGKHLKIQVGEVSIIYAHCSVLYVKQGDKVEQGQEIAEVGSTGNSTGPHLHFEIRFKEKTVDPQKILEL